MPTALSFLTQYSGLSKLTIEQSYSWVIKAMEAWDKHLKEIKPDKIEPNY